MDKLACIGTYPDDCKYNFNSEKLACNSVFYALSQAAVAEAIIVQNPKLQDPLVYNYLIHILAPKVDF